ncbi:MAG: hypothetical protein ACRC8S_04045 [Fimbriiglobus sp.]
MDLTTLRTAAWLRSQGDSWDLIGAKLEISASTLEILPAIRFQDWQQAMIDYAPLIAQDTLLHAQHALRLQSKSLNEKVAQTASLAIMKHDIEEKKLIAKREALFAKTKAKAAADTLPVEIVAEEPILESPLVEAPEETVLETPIAQTPTVTPPEAPAPVIAEEPEIDLVGQIDWNALPKPPKKPKVPKMMTSFLGGK